jgi:serine/threonine protein phosphatase PrpC
MNWDAYAATHPQAGRSQNEDAYLVRRESPAVTAICDGAGNAERAAKRVLMLFEKLFKEGKPGEVRTPEAWSRWVKVLDSSLLGASQSTFLAVAPVEDRVVGACVGDSKAHLIDRNGEVRILTEGALASRD